MNINYHLEFDIAGLIIHIILLVILDNLYSKSKNNQRFKRFLILSFISGFFDVVSAITISNVDIVPVWVNVLLNSVYLCFAALAVYSIYIYVYSCINYYPKVDMFISKIVFIVYLVLIFINSFTGIIFDFSEGFYKGGPLYLLNFIVPVYFAMHLGYLIIFKSKYFSEKQQILHSVVMFFPLVAVVIQVLYPVYLLTFFAYTLFSLMVLFSLETPDFEELEYLRNNLEKEVIKQTAEVNNRQKKIQKMSMEIVETLVETIDAKDNYTNGHSVRVAKYSVLLAEQLGFSEEMLDEVRCAALLHDVGKIGIPDNLLKKPMSLDDEEFDIIKSHTTTGSKILQKISSLPAACTVAKYHHECYDGSGYPEHLSGKDIPEYARIVSIADAYDAMNTKRVYRENLPKEKIREQLMEGRGKQFDPEILDVFLKLFDMNLI